MEKGRWREGHGEREIRREGDGEKYTEKLKGNLRRGSWRKGDEERQMARGTRREGDWKRWSWRKADGERDTERGRLEVRGMERMR